LNGVADMGPPDFSRSNRSVLNVCFVGRFVEHKGIMRLLEAVNIAHCHGISVQLLLAGGGPLENDARSFVFEHNLCEVVDFLGYVDSPGEVYRASDLCCLPSLHEGLPLSLLEAMSAGCALLGHDIPGVRDVIRHGVNGVLTEVTPDAIAVAFMELASDRVYLDDLRKNARQDYEQKWQLDRMVDETEAVYRRVINA